MSRSWKSWMVAVAAVAGLLVAAGETLAKKPECPTTQEPAQMVGLAGWEITPVMTVGEIDENGDLVKPAEFGDYIIPGILDGIGAFKIKGNKVRVLVNHEFGSSAGYPYTLASGAELTGARVSYLDIDRKSLGVCDAGLAYDKMYNRAGKLVTGPDDLVFGGLARLCSSVSFKKGEYGLLDDLYFAGEETGGGSEWVLDVENNALWAAPALGVAGWENVTLISTGRWWETAVLVGDDRQSAPLLLFVGTKKPWMRGPENVLARNGLDQGKLFVWVADEYTSPNDFSGVGNQAKGCFVEIDYYRPDLAGTEGYDELGYATQAKQDELAETAGAFKFSRPEDVSTNPRNKNQIVMASTGGRSIYPTDTWGTIYKITVSVQRKWWIFGPKKMKANVGIIYNADTLAEPDAGIRSPDNLDWADDGYIYVQEDRSTGLFGQATGEEASIWQLNPHNGDATRVAQMDRSAVPAGQSDPVPSSIGNWESSGVLDVSKLFGVKKGTLLIADTQAHSLRDGVLASEGLVEGGQLFFMYKADKKDNGKDKD